MNLEATPKQYNFHDEVITTRNSIMWEKRFLKETQAIIQAVIVKRNKIN